MAALSGTLLLALCGHLAASPASDLEQHLQRYASLGASFRQQVTEVDGYQGQTLEGKLELRRPNLIRWETQPPFTQLLVADGEQIWLYDPDLAQVTVRPWTSDPVVNPGALLAGSVPLVDFFEVSRDGAVYSLVPNAGSSTLARVTIELDERELPQRIEIVDSLQQTTTIWLSEVETGIEFPDANFRFEPPPGVDIYRTVE